MGKTFSKQKNKIHDFSFPFIDNAKATDDLKLMEEEKNKALLDKKRFAIRLSDVEELYAKKCDLNSELESKILDLILEKKNLEDKISSIRVDQKICQIERTIALLVISKLQRENKSMELLLKTTTSSQELLNSDTQLDNTVVSFEDSSYTAAKQIIDKLLSELDDNDTNLSILLRKLEVIHQQRSQTFGSHNELKTKLETNESGSEKYEVDVQDSIDSFGAEKSILPYLCM
jgi:hypothetical protein